MILQGAIFRQSLGRPITPAPVKISSFACYPGYADRHSQSYGLAGIEIVTPAQQVLKLTVTISIC